MKGGVVAVIVARGQPAQLLRHLDMVFGQTRRPDRVIVIDQAGGYDLQAVVTGCFPAAMVAILPGSLGPAAALAYGFQQAVEVLRGSWLWVLDDEGEPASDCLEQLLAAASRHGLDAAGPGPIDPPGPALAPWRQEPVPGSRDLMPMIVRSSGTLFHRNLLLRSGYPRAEAIGAGDDSGFLRRLRTAGISCATVGAARYVHPRPVGHRLGFEDNRDAGHEAQVRPAMPHVLEQAAASLGRIQALASHWLRGAPGGLRLRTVAAGQSSTGQGRR